MSRTHPKGWATRAAILTSILLIFLSCDEADYVMWPNAVDLNWEQMYNIPVDHGSEISLSTDHSGRVHITGANSRLPFIIETDLSGDSLWATTVEAAPSCDWFRSLISNNEYTYLNTCFSDTAFESNIQVASVDSSGNLLWNQSINGSKNCYGYSVLAVGDGSNIIVGYASTETSIGGDLYLSRVNSFGETLWSREIDYRHRTNGGFSATRTDDGALVVAGFVIDDPSSYLWKPILYKVDIDGTVIWSNSVEESGPEIVGAHITQGTSGAIYSASNHGYESTVRAATSIARFDAEGDLVWIRPVGEGKICQLSAIIEATPSRIVAVGQRYDDSDGYSNQPYIVVIDAAGRIVKEQVLEVNRGNTGSLHSICRGPNGILFFAGDISGRLYIGSFHVSTL